VLSIAIAAITVITVGVFVIRYWLHPFLSPNAPRADAGILIVEGWMDDASLKRVLPVFAAGNYSKLVTVGGPLTMGAYLSPHKTLAELSAATLIAFGFDSSALVAVPSTASKRDRTATTATAFCEWLSVHYPKVTSVNLYSHGVHARRSWILYKRELEPAVRVGIIAPIPVSYNPNYWWRSSEGTKRVIVECIALTYTLFPKRSR